MGGGVLTCAEAARVCCLQVYSRLQRQQFLASANRSSRRASEPTPLGSKAKGTPEVLRRALSHLRVRYLSGKDVTTQPVSTKILNNPTSRIAPGRPVRGS
ncbi:hypothetical protein GCM10027162_59720 [Streptomyces incanus]